MVDRFPSAPRPVKAASLLLVCACVLGLVLTVYAAWAIRSVPAGTGALLESLDRGDRQVLKQSWVTQGQRMPLLDQLPLLVWLGLAYLVFLPLAYSIRRRYRPARTVMFLFAAALTALAMIATVSDDDLPPTGVDQLSGDAHAAWLALLPPGYHGVHDAVLTGMIACLLLACLLLDQPSARRFFPRRRAVRAVHPGLRSARNG